MAVAEAHSGSAYRAGQALAATTRRTCVFIALLHAAAHFQTDLAL